jgi:aldose 1-epimerase
VELLSLRSNHLDLQIVPATGGSIARLDLRRADGALPILRPADPAALVGDGAAQAAMHPLVPFANRVPDNFIDLVDPPIRLQPNVAGESCALHGIGWQRAWRVLQAREDRCVMELIVPENEWVFGFRATQEFSVQESQFHAGIVLENISKQPIPAGIGFHPYFVRTAGMTMQFHATRFWLEGPGHLPTDAIAIPPELDFADPAPIPGTWTNNCYSGWDGQAKICDPARGLELHLDASATLRELMLYTPPSAAFFCIEPQSHTSGAANRARAHHPATPLRVIAPSEAIAGDFTIEVSL